MGERAGIRAAAHTRLAFGLAGLRRAKELGMTYAEYTAIVLDRGTFL